MEISIYVCKNIYVFSLPFFILALFLASRGGWKLAVAIVGCMVRKSTIGGKSSLPMYGRKAYYRGEKFVTYVWGERVLSGEKVCYLF